MEGKRVLLSRSFLLILAALLAINCFFFLYQQAGASGDFRRYGEIYHQVVLEHAAVPLEESAALSDAFGEVYRAYNRQNTDSSYNWDYIYRRRAHMQVETQSEHLLGYGKYLTNIQKSAKQMQSVSIFGDPDSFSYKNTVKTAEDFAGLLDVTVTAGHDLAVTEVFSDSWADYSCVFAMIVVCALFLMERREGLWSMVHATPRGRWRLACRRVGTLLAAAALSTLVLLGSRILLSGWLFHGLGEWDRTLQSIPMFYNVPRAMTIGQFWLFYLAVKTLGTFLMGLVLWCILSAIANPVLAFCCAGLVLGAEYACTAILPNSMFALLRYCNVFSYLRFVDVFSAYLNLNIFGVPIAGSELVLMLLVPLCLIFAVAAVLIAQFKRPVVPANRLLRLADRVSRWISSKTTGGGIFAQEARKLLWCRKGILILLALVILVYNKDAPERKYEPEDMYLQYYQEKYAGPITSDTVAALEAELTTAQESNRIYALELLIMGAQNAPEGAWMVPTDSYEAIWSNNYNNYHRSTALIALLMLVLTVAPLMAQERQSDMTLLLRASPLGRRRLFWKKQLLLILVTVFVWAMVYGGELWKTVEYWGPFLYPEAPAISLEVFQPYGWTAPLWLVMVLYYAAKLLVLLIAAELCCFLSSRCRRNRDALLLCCAVIVLPAALAAIGSALGEKLSLLLPLGGVELFA